MTQFFFYIEPAKIIEVFSKSTGGSGVLSESGNMKKVVVKQGEPVQLLCSTEGYPKPTVQWTKKVSVLVWEKYKIW